MAEPLFSLVNIAVLVFSVTSMLSVGFSYTLREIVEPLRDLPGVLLALAANFVLVPLLAYGPSSVLAPSWRRCLSWLALLRRAISSAARTLRRER